MKDHERRFALWGAALFAVTSLGCAGLGLPERTPDKKPAEASPAAKAAPAPAPPAPQAPLDVRDERRLTKDLLRDVEAYYRLLQEKNVEEAANYVDPQYRQAYQNELWTFVANYKIESTQVLSQQLFPQPDGVMAKVRVARTLFEKTSVTPKKSEIWMTWMQRDGRWLIRPQEQK